MEHHGPTGQLFPHRQWLQVNWNTLIMGNIPAMHIADFLVSAGVYSPLDDDYQRIHAEPTASAKVRVLLETMSSKSAGALKLFRDALAQMCPHVFAVCVEAPDALRDLDNATCAYYKTLQSTPFSWLKSVKPVDVGSFYLNLSLVKKSIAEDMISSVASSSTNEIKRQQYLYNRPEKESLVCLDELFPQFQAQKKVYEAAADSEQTTHEHDSMQGHISYHTEDTLSFMSQLQLTQRVGIYGGAGCGKTSCLLKAARMYADNELWRGARAFLLWKLRDPDVQSAADLEQLLQQLIPGLTREKCKAFAAVLNGCDGAGVILALDGIDELDARKTGFIWRLLDGRALSQACVLATSRPSFEANKYFDEYQVKLELLGFTEAQVDSFIEKQFVDKQDLALELRQVLCENPMLASLMFVPLLAVMICQAFHFKGDKPPTTKSLLYSKLLALVVRLTVEERVPLPTGYNRSLLANSEVLKLTGRPQVLLSELAEVAFQAHEQGMAIFDDNIIDEAKCSEDALKLGLLNWYSKEKDFDIVRQYSFQHLTVQEFLVAYRLVTRIPSEDEVTNADVLIRSKHNHTVLQFFAGLLAKCFQPHFFELLSQWLHEGYDQRSDDHLNRLRVCLQCAQEACGGDVQGFPSTLRLPKHLWLDHVTAADLTQMSLVLQSQDIETLELNFEKVMGHLEDLKVSRVMTQTKTAMTKLMVTINANQSLRELTVYGPRYSLFEQEGWRLLVQALDKHSLLDLWVADCELDNTAVHVLSDALKHNKQLKYLYLVGNRLDDDDVRALAEALELNDTLQGLDLTANSYGEECREHLLQRLKHIQDLEV